MAGVPVKSMIGGIATGFRGLRNRATPVPFVSRSRFNFANMFNPDSKTAQMAAMGSVGTLFAIVDRLADSVSEVEWQLWRTARSGKDADRRQVTSHAALDLLDANPFCRRRQLFEASQQHFELVGEANWLIYSDPRAPDLPLYLWPVRPDRITPVPHPTEFLTGWIYHGPDGEQIPLDRSQVIQIKRPHPLDPYRGCGPVQAILADIDSSRYGAEWNRNFFLNGAEPGGIVEIPETLDDDEFKQMSDRWAEQHQGIHNAHRVAILERGKWVERKFSMRDMQFTELRNVSREVIREAFGFPKMMLGATDDINRANAIAGETMYARWLVQPRGERWKDVLNFELLPKFGARGLEFDYVTPIPASREDTDRERDSLSKAWATLVTAGAEGDDAADWLGMPRMRVREPATVQPSGSPSGPPAAEPAARR
jgi:HK97 family phage portal protein